MHSNFMFLFELSCKNTKHGNTHTRTYTHRDSDKYSIVATIKTKPEASWYKISGKKAYTNSKRIFTLRTE